MLQRFYIPKLQELKKKKPSFQLTKGKEAKLKFGFIKSKNVEN
jgi:hypothetical protein